MKCKKQLAKLYRRYNSQFLHYALNNIAQVNRNPIRQVLIDRYLAHMHNIGALPKHFKVQKLSNPELVRSTRRVLIALSKARLKDAPEFEQTTLAAQLAKLNAEVEKRNISIQHPEELS